MRGIAVSDVRSAARHFGVLTEWLERSGRDQYLGAGWAAAWAERTRQDLRIGWFARLWERFVDRERARSRSLLHLAWQTDSPVRRCLNDDLRRRLMVTHKVYFDTVESNPLTERQRWACVTDEDATLVIAGAGTGKTSTILAKIGLLIRCGQCRPEEILAISFTRKSAKELEERIEKKLEEEKGSSDAAKLEQRKARIQSQGLNENYAREIMELHTLGVDGGYTQQDVTEAARVLTGWTIFPGNEEGPGKYIRKMIDQVGEDRLTRAGFVHDGDFLFAMNRHDNKEKTVLGHRFPAGHGYDEGLELIDMLAMHRSTARFICKKIAVRFVSDDPPASLVDQLADSYIRHGGDITEVLKTLVSLKEFWDSAARGEKTRSPFELAIYAVRALHAEVKAPYPLYTYITKMGQKVYFYQAPTGFPDKGSFWINAGSLLNRMNFGMDLATQRIPGVKVDLPALNDGHEPESAAAALHTYASILLPERNLDPTMKRLTPLVNDPSLQQKLEQAAPRDNDAMAAMNDEQMEDANNGAVAGPIRKTERGLYLLPGKTDMLSQVVGIIVGSPEFQRR